MKIFSREWMEEIAKRLRESEEYQQAAKGFDSTVSYVAEPEPEKGITRQYVCGIRLPQADEIWVDEDRPADFVLSAQYGNFVKIIKGELSPTAAMMSGKLKLKGSLMKIMRYGNALNIYNRIIQSVPVEFEGDYGK